MKVRVWFLAALGVSILLLSASPGQCLEGPLSFEQFLLVNDGNRESFNNASLVFERRTDIYRGKDSFERNRLRMEEMREEVRNDPKLTQERKEESLRDIERFFRDSFKSHTFFEMKNNLLYDRTGKRYRCDIESTDSSDLEENPTSMAAYKQVKRISIFADGVTKDYEPIIKSLTVDVDKDESDWLRRDEPFLGTLDRRSIRPSTDVAVTTEEIDGSEVVLYVLTDRIRDLGMKIYADPSLGYRCRRVEYFRKGFMNLMIEAKEYKDCNGIPFPNSYALICFSQDTDCPISSKEQITLTDASFNVPINEESFKLDVPEGTQVYDQNLQRSYVVGELEDESAVPDLWDLSEPVLSADAAPIKMPAESEQKVPMKEVVPDASQPPIASGVQPEGKSLLQMVAIFVIAVIGMFLFVVRMRGKSQVRNGKV